MPSVAIDTDRNRLGRTRVATTRWKKDDPSSIPFDAAAVTATSLITNLDTYLEANGYTAAQVQVMSYNDKVYAYRLKTAANGNPLNI